MCHTHTRIKISLPKPISHSVQYRNGMETHTSRWKCTTVCVFLCLHCMVLLAAAHRNWLSILNRSDLCLLFAQLSTVVCTALHSSICITMQTSAYGSCLRDAVWCHVFSCGHVYFRHVRYSTQCVKCAVSSATHFTVQQLSLYCAELYITLHGNWM